MSIVLEPQTNFASEVIFYKTKKEQRSPEICQFPYTLYSGDKLKEEDP